MMLKQVDLPAPFGPISARNSPPPTEKLTSSTARTAPKLLRSARDLKLRHAARHRAVQLHERADEAGRESQHQDQNDAAEQRVPIFGLLHDVSCKTAKTEAPTIGPASVWMPPSSTMTRPSMERPMLMVSGEIEPLAKAKTPPATPQTVPAMAKASQCTRLTLMPIASARSGESRPARIA